MRGLTSLVLLSLALCSTADAQSLKYKQLDSKMRPYLFVDDNKWEALDRTRPLPSQSRLVGNAVPSDARMYLLRDQVKPQGNGELQAAYGKTVEELLTTQILPAFSKLSTMDLTTGEAPITVLMGVLKAATDQLRAKLPQLEAAEASGGLATAAGARQITFLIAPWDKAPFEKDEHIRIHERQQRFAPRQQGFSSYWRTPTRDWARKHWLFDEQTGTAVSSGVMGNFDNRIEGVFNVNHISVYEDPYTVKEHLNPPFVYPIAFLVNLKIQPGSSSIRVQTLLGLNPMIQNLVPAPAAQGPAAIQYAGVPQAVGLTAVDKTLRYPLTLVSFNHLLAQPLPVAKLHFDFGIWGQYDGYRRNLSVLQENNAWRLAPFLGGTLALKVPGTDKALEFGIRIHMRDFDIMIPTDPAKNPSMENLQTSVEIFDKPEGGKLVPFSTHLNIGFKDGKATTQASKEVQKSINDMMTKAFVDARKSSREKALKTFPMATMFLDK